jgi:NTE family protein
MEDTWVADLVLQGGGVKGIGLVGAVSALHDKGYVLGDPGRVAGTSAGAIVGSLVAAGMPVPELVRLMRGLDYRQFRDSPPLWALGRGVALLTTLGMHRGDEMHRWIEARLADCGVRTFRDLKLCDPCGNLPPERSYKLVVVVSDVSNGRMLRLPWDYACYGLDPDEQPVADAVRASASIPFYFRPYRLALPDRAGDVLCTDGGMLSNFPVHIFDRYDRTPRWPTFGVMLAGRPAPGNRGAGTGRIRGPVGFGKALLSTMINAHDRLDLDDPGVSARTVFVETHGLNATDFDLDPDTRDELYRAGRQAAKDFLATWDFTDYLRRYRPS